MAKRKIIIDAYSGYGNNNKFFCMGRVLEDKRIEIKESDSSLKHAVAIYRHAESDEIPHQKVHFTFAKQEDSIYTNSEGFYKIESELENFDVHKEIEPITFHIKKAFYEENWNKRPIKSQGKIFFPSPKAKFGVISDIDDTILKTDVLSTMKWKIFYNTFFIRASKRMVIRETNTWYQKLRKGKTNENNPFFYVSHSPWNLYHYLEEFLATNHFPQGPLLLRDFGLKAKDTLQEYKNHKHNEIVRILNMYPKLNFILIGDGGEKDAKIYLNLKKKYPKRILAIFIRRMGTKKHQDRIERWGKGHENYFFYIKKAADAMKVTQNLGYF